MEPQRGAQRLAAARLSLAAGFFVLALKGAAWFRTGSVAILSDALESIVNVVAALLLLASLRFAVRPADRTHPYGHGKIEFFAAGVEGALIATAALVIAIEALRNWRSGAELTALDFGLTVMVAASSLNGVVGLYLLRLGRRSQSLALEADGRHLLSDVVTSVGVIAGLLAVWLTGFSWLDPLVALAVAAHILWVGWLLVRRAIGGLMDEADLPLLTRIATHFEQGKRPWWIDVHSLRTWRSGPFLHADLHLVVPRFLDADRLHEVGEEVEAVFRDGAGSGEAIVHFDPCRPRYCTRCAMPACDIRTEAFRTRIEFNTERVTREDERLEGPIAREPHS